MRPLAIGGRRKPALLRVMHEGTIGAGFAEIEVGPEIMRAEALKEFAVGAGARRQFSCALAVGKQHRAFVILHVGGPDAIDLVQQRGFIEMKAACGELRFHRGDG